MANSTTNLDLVLPSQASKEVTVNAALDSMSPASVYGRRSSTCSGLTWGFFGGNVTLSGGSMSQIANGTLTLTASATNYIVANKSTGAVSFSTATTNWNGSANYWRLYSVVVGSATVTSYTDSRELAKYTGGGAGDMAQTITAAKTFKAGMLLLRNVADTFSSLFTNTATAARTWTLPDKDGRVVLDTDPTDAWVAYTPIPSAGTGAFTTASASGYFKKIGKTVFFKYNVFITDVGTAGYWVSATLPTTASASSYGLGIIGRENGVTGAMLLGSIQSTTTAVLQKYDGTFCGGNGYSLSGSGCYEEA